MVGVNVDVRDNVGLAFVAVIAAGLSTSVGAAIVFFPKLVKLASQRVLASSLAISAGVMTYVSFVEIFQKAIGGFEEGLGLVDGHNFSSEKVAALQGRAYGFTTLSFFGGIMIMKIVDLIVKKLSGEDHHSNFEPISDSGKDNDSKEEQKDDEYVVPHCVGCASDPIGELNDWKEKAKIEEQQQIIEENKVQTASFVSGGSDGKAGQLSDAEEGSQRSEQDSKPVVSNVDQLNELAAKQNMFDEDGEKQKLIRMGFSTALAIAIHNFPEGLATFVAVLNEPEIGIILAIAIAIHNIPEGFCVALPVYYATGNRLKAFMWGTLSGLSEPVGALLGWLVLANTFSPTIYGLMFGMVAGMMVIISLKELLPTAYRYDPGDTVVTNSLVVGMVVIALSLILYYV